ncbi:MAG: alkaline phosphatase D family protein [Chitinophagales bacterium]
MHFLFSISWILISLSHLQAENPLDALKNPELSPFYYGVASGDPLQDRVILWTKVDVENSPDSISVFWEIARDTAFKDIANSGTAISHKANDFTVKVDANRLQSNTWYYYRFSFEETYSLTGRTKTLPADGEVDAVRLAVASCQDYEFGYYNAYKSMVDRNQADAVVFLGDYIYEYGSYALKEPTIEFRKRRVRYNYPEHEIVSLEDYRNRYRLYRLDSNLREAHRQFPWICVWDDHEHANNAWRTGAQNHQPETEGDWEERLARSIKVYHEWLPIRLPEEDKPIKIYRNFEFGKLFNLLILDARIIGRDKPVSRRIDIKDTLLNQENRYLLGLEQMQWIENTLANSESEWTILGQQIMMAPLLIKNPIFDKTKVGNSDQWDGYPQERNRLRSIVEQNNIDNLVVLSGDIHTAIVSHLPKSNFRRGRLANNWGVEFVTPSISSRNLEKRMLLFKLLTRSFNPNIKFLDLFAHGYYILDIRKESVQADYFFANRIKTRIFKERKVRSYYVNNGKMRIRKSRKKAMTRQNYPPLAP